MDLKQQILNLGGPALEAERRKLWAKDFRATLYRCHAWTPFHLRPPLVGCGPFTPSNDNPYWPAAASEAARFEFDIGGYQSALFECLSREAGDR
jgi:hypothetical protein